MTQQASAHEIFSAFQDYMAEEQDTREEIRNCTKEIEQKAREILMVLQAVHQPDGVKQLTPICTKARALYPDIQALFKSLSTKVPQDQYYRFNDHWRFVIQRLCFLAALIVYLETETMITREENAALLGIATQREQGFHLELDDYLMGLLLMANELSRLAVNAVTAGDYTRPMRIARFVGELDSGFRLLNLKNDSLRKKFDGLKYDLKKVEEVVYDVTIRGLNKESAGT